MHDPFAKIQDGPPRRCVDDARLFLWDRRAEITRLDTIVEAFEIVASSKRRARQRGKRSAPTAAAAAQQ